MFPADLAKEIAKKVPKVSLSPEKSNFVSDPQLSLVVLPSYLREVCRALRDTSQLLFDLPLQMTAVDYVKEKVFELVYYLYSSKLKQGVILKTQIPRSQAAVDSIADVWPGMDWQEREVYDLFGIQFKNHPNLKRIMLWEGFPGHPLRKDYVHTADKYDSGLEIGTPGLDERGVPMPEN